MHATVPGLSEKEPGSHFWQVAEPNAEDTVPGSHLVHPEAPADEKVPAKQSEHVATEVAPSTAEDVPPAQAVLSFAPPVQKYPLGHLVPSADFVPEGNTIPH